MNRPAHLAIRALIALPVALVACSSGSATTAEPSAMPAASSGTPTGSAVASEPAASRPPSPPSSAAASEPPQDALLAVLLTDVRSGETFTLGELAADGPILLEPMAVWCSNCRAQQHEVKRAHEDGAAFTSVSLDVDLSETPEDLAAYADREGFDWRFAMADADLFRLLQERFGTSSTVPPATPLIVIVPDGTVRPLEFGVGTRSADQLRAEIGAG